MAILNPHGPALASCSAPPVVDGEIYNESLVIEQNAQFEGVSRRLNRPVEAPTSDQLNGAAPSLTPSAPAPVLTEAPAAKASDALR
jgi:hypothetical protein